MSEAALPERLVSTGWSRQLRATAAACVFGLGAGLALYLVAKGAGAVDSRVVLPSLLGMGPLSAASVSVTIVAATAAGGMLLALLAATTRRPVLYFRVAATAMAALSLSLPLTIPGPPPAMRTVMVALHLVVWAVTVTVLPQMAWTRGARS